jgi:hypothetical protein
MFAATPCGIFPRDSRLGENRFKPKPTAVENIGDKLRMNCAEPSISSTENFNSRAFIVLEDRDLCQSFIGTREHGGTTNICNARLEA